MELDERIARGIEEARAGKTIDRGDFRQYLDEDENIEEPGDE